MIKIEKIPSGFSLETEIAIKELFVKVNSNYLVIPKKTASVFELSLALLMKEKRSDELLFSIYTFNDDTKEYIPLSVKKEELILSDSLSHEWEDTTYIIYISQFDTVRMICEKVSMKSYYIKHRLNQLYFEEDAVIIDLSLQSKYVNINEVILKSRIRDTDKAHIFNLQSTIIGRSESSLNHFTTQFSLKVPLTEWQEITEHVDNRMVFNWDIFDFYIELKIKEHDLIPHDYRLSFIENKKERLTKSLLSQNQVVNLWTFYSTAYGNISMQSQQINQASWEIYKEKVAKNELKRNVKPIMLISEYTSKAQDTGFTFFKSMREHYSDRFDAYYIVSKNSADIKNLSPYLENVLWFKSEEHVKMFFKASIFCHSHSLQYLAPVWDEKSRTHLAENLRVFLQHGVLGVRDMSSLYGFDSGEFTDLFVCSSEREKQLVINELGYAEENVVLSGLSRFDTLLSKESFIQKIRSKGKIEKQILIAPSWRNGQNRYTDEEFIKTDFYKSFSSLLTNLELKAICQTNGFTIKFYLHSNFQHYRHLFTSDFVEIIEEGTVSVQSLIKSAGCLITDFSSLALDFALLKRPIIYYQFLERKQKMRDVATDFYPGTVVQTEKQVVSEVQKFTRNKKMAKEHIGKIANIYKFEDTKAVYRIVKAIQVKINRMTQ